MSDKQKQKEANDRNQSWAALSLKAQLKELDSRPGKSLKQRAKILAKMLEQEKAKA